MIRSGRDSIIPKVLASLLGLLTALSMVLMSVLIMLEHRRLISSLEEQTAEMGDHLASTLAFPVWNAVFREIDAQLDWIMLDPSVYSVSLDMVDIEPSLRARSRDEDWRAVPEPPIPKSGLAVVERSIIYKGQRIASLELYYTKRFIESRITREAILFAALILVEDLTIALGLLLILRLSIFTPLRKIERYAAAVSRGSTTSIPPWKGSRGEIESLHSSIERMVSLLSERYEALVSKEREFHSLFESNPIPTIEFDFSGVLQAIKDEGLVGGVRAKLLDKPDIARRVLARLRARSANAAAISLFGESWRTKLIDALTSFGGEDAYALFIDEIADLNAGAQGTSGECGLRIDGEGERMFILDFATLAGHEEDWSRVILAMTDITPRALAEGRLRKALSEKDALVQELFHRTRNGLQIIAGLITLSESRVTDKRSQGELHGLAKRVQALALAQDQLYKLNDLSDIDLGDYVRTMLPLIVGSPTGPIRVEVASEKITTVIDVAMPLGIALVELTTNAQEHGFPEGQSGTISVSLALMPDDCVEISVRDDGIGPPPGFDPRRDASLGLELVFILIEGQLRGTVDFDFSAGFKCILRFGVTCFEHRV